uniref:Ubiquitin-like protease family profile domain-containing protein n=1 Tax=Oryza brachyantha TaxID=4533 RepID=J3NCX8_ORYBR
IIFPCLYNNHWFIFVVDIKEENFVFLDSPYSEKSAYHIDVHDLIIPGFIMMWYEFSKVNIDFNKFQNKYCVNVIPRQNNLHDCGVYTMKMELRNPRGHQKDLIRLEDISNIRIQISNDLVFSEHNSEEEAKQLLRNFN